MSKAGDVELITAGDAELEDALEALEAVKQKFNFIRSQHILSKAVYHADQRNNSDDEGSISELEDKIDRICIQEGALQFSLENDTLHKIRSSGILSSELQDQLELQLKQEAIISMRSSEILEENSKLQKAQDKLAQTLEEYMNYEKKRSQQFKETSLYEDKECMRNLKRQLTEIRFMQLIIPRMISQLDVDFTQTKWLGKLCQEVREPILTLDDVQ